MYAVSFLVVVYPLAQFALTHQDEVMARTREVNVSKEIDAQDSYQPLRDNIEDSVKILRGLKTNYERHHKVRYTDEAIRAAVPPAYRFGKHLQFAVGDVRAWVER